ncbi:sperm flagellar protein 1-like [Phyllostomus hastatus]|uniref:sperm flagellar protein 1-like n=1 Tax=Phyllostomus hastatus TaxID=9423 RepID=UPI001E6842DA|nr:sperm flagellar protein 1-like [Phyllostomus hastatus]
MAFPSVRRRLLHPLPAAPDPSRRKARACAHASKLGSRASAPWLPSALRGLCAWLDGLPLSRPKRHLARDSSDGVLLPGIVKHIRPQLVDLPSRVPTCNTDQKLGSWSILNGQGSHKLSFCVSEADGREVVASMPGAIEPMLCVLREKVVAIAIREDPPSLLHPPAPSRVKTPWSQRAAEKAGHAVCQGRLPSRRAPAASPGMQQLLEEKQQALAILQETVKSQHKPTGLLRPGLQGAGSPPVPCARVAVTPTPGPTSHRALPVAAESTSLRGGPLCGRAALRLGLSRVRPHAVWWSEGHLVPRVRGTSGQKRAVWGPGAQRCPGSPTSVEVKTRARLL